MLTKTSIMCPKRPAATKTDVCVRRETYVYSKRDVVSENRPTHIQKETCACEDIHTTFDERPRCIPKETFFLKRDPHIFQKRRVLTKTSIPHSTRDLWLFKKRCCFRKQTHRQKETLFSKADPQTKRDVFFENRPTDTFDERPMYIQKETLISKTDPQICQKKRMFTQRDL